MVEEIKVLTEEEKAHCLDFAKRMCFKGWANLTEARCKKLWEDTEWFLTDLLEEGATGWEDDHYPCDRFSERFEEKYFPNTTKWNSKFENGEEPEYYRLLHCICRAAFDIIDQEHGSMVMGFTIGDIKRMYEGVLPDWFVKMDWIQTGDGKVDISKQPDSDTIAI